MSLKNSIMILLFLGTAFSDSVIDLDFDFPGWTHPDYSLSIDTIINPLDYGEQIASFCETARIGLVAFWITEGSDEYWRLAMLFKDRIFILQDHSPHYDQHMLDIHPRYFFWSKNGNLFATDSPCTSGSMTSVSYFDVERQVGGSVHLLEDRMDEFTAIINSQWISNENGVLCYLDGTDTTVDSVDTSIYQVFESLSVQNSSADISWLKSTCRKRSGLAVGNTGKYFLLTTDRGIVCCDAHSSEPLFTGFFDFETKNPLISPGEAAWVIEARPIVYYPQTCPSSYIVGNFDDPLTTSIAYISSGGYWSDSRIMGFSDSGRLLLSRSDSHYSRSILLLESDGTVIWQTGPMSLLNGEHQMTHNSLNSDRKRVVAALSSDGKRVIFSDFNRIYVISIE